MPVLRLNTMAHSPIPAAWWSTLPVQVLPPALDAGQTGWGAQKAPPLGLNNLQAQAAVELLSLRCRCVLTAAACPSPCAQLPAVSRGMPLRGSAPLPLSSTLSGVERNPEQPTMKLMKCLCFGFHTPSEQTEH
ncbi:hypothetical protein Y1Q_0022476 [Alligator mississippiensis]|uniref:Uncharacterized protein n=1 Tax=Alligator mississippiensis TaxID=8496 RepID=A0A151N0J5_ALLMI|nr:hypothetical protein Y1Q_0022476 [Alligator mississippiensis]